jgi:hypothetical protein
VRSADRRSRPRRACAGSDREGQDVRGRGPDRWCSRRLALQRPRGAQNAPCDAQLPQDARIAVGLGDRARVFEPSEAPRIVEGARFSLQYEEHGVMRTIVQALSLVGVAAGTTMAIAGAPGDHQPWKGRNIVLVSGGLAVDIGSLALFTGPGQARDIVRMTPY